MESVFKINNFDSLPEDVQQDIQDFIAGLTVEWQIEIFNHCDACGEESELIKKETSGGIIRICPVCNSKGKRYYEVKCFDNANTQKTTLGDFK